VPPPGTRRCSASWPKGSLGRDPHRGVLGWQGGGSAGGFLSVADDQVVHPGPPRPQLRPGLSTWRRPVRSLAAALRRSQPRPRRTPPEAKYARAPNLRAAGDQALNLRWAAGRWRLMRPGSSPPSWSSPSLAARRESPPAGSCSRRGRRHGRVRGCARGSGSWRLGLASYQREELCWVRRSSGISMAARTRCVPAARSLRRSVPAPAQRRRGRAQPGARHDRGGVPARRGRWFLVRAGPWRLALGEAALTGLLSWLEAAARPAPIETQPFRETSVQARSPPGFHQQRRRGPRGPGGRG